MQIFGGGVDCRIRLRGATLATANHFTVHGQPEGGTNVAPGNYSEHVIRESYLRPFEAAVKEGRVRSVMASYNEIDGIPSHSNKHLLDDILRHEWGFDGILVSDARVLRQNFLRACSTILIRHSPGGALPRKKPHARHLDGNQFRHAFVRGGQHNVNGIVRALLGIPIRSGRAAELAAAAAPKPCARWHYVGEELRAA
jgi:hypothetical protein